MATRQPPTRKQSTQVDHEESGRQPGGLRKKPYFYDAQIKRMIVQILACFAGYQVRTGVQRDGEHHFMDVPILYGSMDRAVGYILQGGSENTVSYIPVMSLMMTGMRQKAEWRQQPQHIEKLQFIERARDSEGNLIVGQPGRRTTIERYQPVPYELSFSLSIWASNQDQGFQILEQIGVVFNPEMDIALSNSIADWTFLTTLNFGLDVQFEAAQPQGTDIDPFNVITLPFTTTLWLSAPAKVMDTKHIYEIHVPILDLDGLTGEVVLQDTLLFDDLEQLDKCVIRADEGDILRFETFG